MYGRIRGHRAGCWLGGVLVAAALVLPRAVLFHLWVPSVPPEAFYAPSPALHVVRARLEELGALGFRVAGVEGGLAPHTAAFFELEEARTYDPMTYAPYARFLEGLGEVPRSGWVSLRDPAHPALAFLGVRFLFDQPPAHRRSRRFGVPVAYRGRDAVLWERPDALPRVFFPERVVVEADPERAVLQARGLVDFRALAVVDRGTGEESDGSETPAGSHPAPTVDELRVAPGRIEATVTEPGPAILASSQPAIPGWRLLVDGDAAPDRLRRINGAFLGVAVPAGRHSVELRYAPRSWHVGRVLAALGALAAAGLLLLPPARRSA